MKIQRGKWAHVSEPLTNWVDESVPLETFSVQHRWSQQLQVHDRQAGWLQRERLWSDALWWLSANLQGTSSWCPHSIEKTTTSQKICPHQVGKCPVDSKFSDGLSEHQSQGVQEIFGAKPVLEVLQIHRQTQQVRHRRGCRKKRGQSGCVKFIQPILGPKWCWRSYCAYCEESTSKH